MMWVEIMMFLMNRGKKTFNANDREIFFLDMKKLMNKNKKIDCFCCNYSSFETFI